MARRALFFFERVPAEVDEGLRGLGDVAILFPRQPDVDEDGLVEGQRDDSGRLLDDEVEQEGDARAACDQTLDGLDLVRFEHDVGRDVFLLEGVEQELSKEGAVLEHDEVHILDVMQGDGLLF